MVKGIIPSVGALMTWTIIPGAGVQIFCLVVIPMGGQISYFIIEGLLSLVWEPICVGWLLS
jgi:hypothetical protein